EERLRRLAEQRAKEAQQRWILELERLAGTETVVYQNSRWIALLPLGVGEFQNGRDGWGWWFALSAVVLGPRSIVTGVIAENYASRRGEKAIGGVPIVQQELGNRYRIATTFNRILFGLWAADTVWGIAQAQIRFVPEREVTKRQRPVPPRPPPPPTITPSV